MKDERLGTETQESLKFQSNDSIENAINYHEIMDLVLTTYKDIYKDKIVYLKYELGSDYFLEKRKKYLLGQELNPEEQKMILNLLDWRNKDFEFDKEKLSQESQRILKNKGKTTDKNVSFIFNGFISNEENNKVIAWLSVLYDNELFTSTTSGSTGFLFLKKENNKWEITRTIVSIFY